MMTLTLTFDQPRLDGVPAARFPLRLRELLQSPYLINAWPVRETRGTGKCWLA